MDTLSIYRPGNGEILEIIHGKNNWPNWLANRLFNANNWLFVPKLEGFYRESLSIIKRL